VLTSIVSDAARGILTTGAFSLVQHPFEKERLCAALDTLLPSSGADRKALFVPSAEASETQLSELKECLTARGIGLQIAASFPDALAATITESPDIIVIDTAMAATPLSELIGALKVEEEAARIPIVLLSEDISDAHVHRHAGSRAADNASALEYLYEQLTRVISASSEMTK
jgi:CheY-like chemotaxis protein